MKLGLILFCISLLVSGLVLNPKIKAVIFSVFGEGNREILSQLSLDHAGQSYKVLKVKNSGGLAVELYRSDDKETVFLDRKQLTDKKDASYRFDDESHNLFLKDINQDGVAEVILPSVDKNMKARLNVYSIDFENEVLQKQTQH